MHCRGMAIPCLCSKGVHLDMQNQSSCTGSRSFLWKRKIPLDLFLWSCLFVLLPSAVQGTLGDDESSPPSSSPSSENQCGIWIAPSTIPGAGIGIFAGKGYERDEILAQDLVIPLLDLPLYHPSHTTRFPKPFVLDNYSWQGDTCLLNEGHVEVDCVSPGFGAVPNCMFPLINVRDGVPTQDSAGLHRSKDAGVGGFTYYHGRSAIAKTRIAAGSELFVDYGTDWFQTRKEYDSVPLTNDLARASQFFRKYSSLKQFVARIEQNSTIDVAKMMQDLWHAFVRESDLPPSPIFGSFNHRDEDELRKLEDFQGSLSTLRRQQSIRSMEWLDKNGRCVDNIIPRVSTLPQAGRGAFARRDMPEGTVVAPMPLIHIHNRIVIDTYPIETQDSEEPFADMNGNKSAQLLLNYCFGHPESTLLLFPYAPYANFVNHNQTLANIRIQWADPNRSNHMPQLLNSPFSTLKKQKTAILAFELVATRDIKEGEEIFMNYGDDWERKWLDHVNDWKPVEGAEHYLPSFHFNRNEKRLKVGSQENHYPPNVEIRVFEQFFGKSTSWKIEMKRKLRLFSEREGSNATLDWGEETFAKQQAAVELTDGSRPVDILSVEETDDGEHLYTIRDHEDNKTYSGLPRLAFYFFDKPQTTDMYLENAFRHHIGIPDDMMPNSWRNLRGEDSGDTKDEL